VIVVSEQTGEVSLASRGKIEKLSKKDSIQERLAEYLRIK